MAAPKALTEKRIQCALEMVKENPGISITQLADALGLSRDALYNWKRYNTHNWNERYAEALNEAFSALEGPAIEAMSRLIEKDSFQAAKYILDNRNYGAAQKIQADVNTDITIDVTIEE
jgi:hypothetical protein